MKILVISDVHLTEKFDERKYNFLKKIISSADRVILNGDFWDGYLTTFNRFILSKWSMLFPLLKEKNAIYLFGNHDKKEFSDQRTSLFSDQQGYIYKVRLDNKTYIFQHGHLISPSLEDKIGSRLIAFFFTVIVHLVLSKIFHFLRWNPFRFISVKENNNLKNFTKSKKSTYFFGHTHLAEKDLLHNYVNSGYIDNGVAQYVLIKDNKISLKEELYA